jgi:hypothetical protein
VASVGMVPEYNCQMPAVDKVLQALTALALHKACLALPLFAMK